MRVAVFTCRRIVAVVVVAIGVGCGAAHPLAPGTDAGSAGAQGSGGHAAATGGSGSGGIVAGSGGTTGSGGDGGDDCAVPAVPPGGHGCTDILIDSAAAVTAAEDCTEATGSVMISPTFTGTVELPRLRKVGMDVRRDGANKPIDAGDPTQTTRVRLPNVTQIGGDLWFYLDLNLVELDLRSVETIGGRAWVYRDTLIDTLRLDALHTVGEDFYIGDVFELPDCVAKGIASHVTAGQTVIASGNAMPANCHCAAVCGHAEQLCP